MKDPQLVADAARDTWKEQNLRNEPMIPYNVAPAFARNLVSKLAAIMAVIDRVPKRGRNELRGYDYATEADVVALVRMELASRSIMLLPQVDACAIRELPANKREPLTIVNMTFTFMDGDTGESISKPWVGIGQDAGDKGVYKAMTGAEKYFLLKTFLVPTGDDPELATPFVSPTALASPEGAARHEAPPAAATVENRGALTITRVDTTDTKNPAVKRYLVTFSDGTQASTINTLLANTCKEFQALGTVVESPQLENKGDFRNLVSVTARRMAGRMLVPVEGEPNPHAEPILESEIPF